MLHVSIIYENIIVLYFLWGDICLKQLHLIVSGRVQGVGFRYFAQRNALAQQITGWVRNRTDGTVEIVAEGDDKQIDSYLSSIKLGCPFSSVDSVIVKEEKATNNYHSFSIKY